jgi:hypothetical protein
VKAAFIYLATLIGGALLSQLAEVFLPERVRIWFALKKKMLSKWIRNPSYTVGITARLDCRESLELDGARRRLQDLFGARGLTGSGTDLHFREKVGAAQINTKMQLAYDEDKKKERLSVFSINVTVDVEAKYREIRKRIEDLRASLSAAEGVLIKELAVFPAKRALYIEVERLEEFSEWLENLEAQQITGKMKNADAEFAYYDKRLVVEDGINSATITWLKRIVTHVG